MKKYLVMLAAMVALVTTPVAMAADIKVGVIDLQRIGQKSPQVARLNADLEKQFKPRQAKILAAQKELEAEIAKLNREGTVMSVADRTKLQGKIISDRANLQGMSETFRQELGTAKAQAAEKFLRQVSVAVGKVANQGKYTIVLQKAGLPYADASLDITEQVLGELSKA